VSSILDNSRKGSLEYLRSNGLQQAGKDLPSAVRLAEEKRTDPRHLLVVRCGADIEVNGMSETGNGRERDPRDEDEEDFPDGVWADAYENHKEYGFYEQRPCQHRIARAILWTASDPFYPVKSFESYDAARCPSVILRAGATG
jgi:hypothetical protein